MLLWTTAADLRPCLSQQSVQRSNLCTDRGNLNDCNILVPSFVPASVAKSSRFIWEERNVRGSCQSEGAPWLQLSVKAALWTDDALQQQPKAIPLNCCTTFDPDCRQISNKAAAYLWGLADCVLLLSSLTCLCNSAEERQQLPDCQEQLYVFSSSSGLHWRRTSEQQPILCYFY